MALRVLMLATLVALAMTDSAWAEPPCWAPAHGYRAKHGDKGCDKHYRKRHKAKHHRKGRRDYEERDYHERPRGHQDHAGAPSGEGVSAGGLVGAAVGGYAGSKVGKGSGKLAATAGGAVAGYIVGQEVEKQLSGQ